MKYTFTYLPLLPVVILINEKVQIPLYRRITRFDWLQIAFCVIIFNVM